MALSNSSQTSSYGYSTPEETYNHNNAIFPTMSDASTSYQQTSSHFNDRTAIVHELAPSYYSYSPITPSSASTTQSIDPFDYQFTPGGYIPDSDNFSLSFQVPNVTLPLQSSASIEHSVDEHVLYYFSQVQKAQPMFVGNGLADITYTLITQEPKGAVTNAVCALSSLHFVQMRISQGLEMQNPSREQTKATYFRDEAFFQISSSRQLHGRYTDSDAIAALHLVTFSQLSGGQYPWHDAFSILNDWLVQAALPSATNPRLIYENMSNVGQYAVKVILSLDIFTSFSASYPPKFLGLMKELLGKDVWSFRNKDSSHKIQMEAFAGLTNEILLGIAEINALSHWKLLEKNKGSLSYRELVRRGDSIEQLLRENFEPSISRDQVQEHTKVIESVIGAGEEAKRLVIDIFREGALLYLHTVVNGFNPGVPEIMSSVDTILRLFYSLQPSELDRLLVFPTCLAACMTDDSTHREYLKNRLQARSSVIGNLVQIGTVMELVWRRRDANGGAIDLRDAIKETGLALLLV
ncbi:hypothetical protein AMATHDRAFT_55813 [Amanita thiersii Skay4041]|uniref:Uncharacterized protein n=1 Tax=Amanita thiersii Skay4041 TaxID=703135 RepID=A0A2A9NYI7_9AGAR|nr:hypothetical protein AMATHDRAFT_55813 [Amanita thiersii Skay4041]